MRTKLFMTVSAVTVSVAAGFIQPVNAQTHI